MIEFLLFILSLIGGDLPTHGAYTFPEPPVVRDIDGDGSENPAVGGQDCDDSDSTRSPLLTEILLNGVDDDCNDETPVPPPSPITVSIQQSPTVLSSGSVQEMFWQGYRDGGGVADEWTINRIVVCESGWNVYAANPSGATGLAQFMPGTWASVAGETGLWDKYNPYHQGYNTAWLVNNGGLHHWDCW